MRNWKEKIDKVKVNQNEHAALMILALDRDKKAISKLVENHIMTPVEIIKKRYQIASEIIKISTSKF